MGTVCKAMDKVAKILDMMMGRGHEPNVITYGALINGYCKIRRIDEATRLCIIDGLSKQGLVNEAQNLFSEMIRKRISPDVVTYNSLIYDLCNFSRWKEAASIFTDMLNHGISPNVITFNTLVSGLSKEGRTTEAHNVFEIMLTKGEKPNVVTYNSLMHGLCNSGQWKEAKRIFYEIVRRGISPNAVTFT